jgi:hypothetical protein
LVLDFSSFLIYAAFNAINFPLNTAFVACHKLKEILLS